MERIVKLKFSTPIEYAHVAEQVASRVGVRPVANVGTGKGRIICECEVRVETLIVFLQNQFAAEFAKVAGVIQAPSIMIDDRK